MLRLGLIILFSNLLANGLQAQPPLVLMGQAEIDCSSTQEKTSREACAQSSAAPAEGNAADLSTPMMRFDLAHAAQAKSDERGAGYFIFGESASLAHGPYLAFAPQNGLSNPQTWEVFAGRGLSGTTGWLPYEIWIKANSAEGQWRPSQRAKLFNSEQTCRNYSAWWNEPLHRWLMVYACSDSLWLRAAAKPSGPWSDATKLISLRSDSFPPVLIRSQFPGPRLSGSRTTTLYWSLVNELGNNDRIFSATLSQEGEH